MNQTDPFLDELFQVEKAKQKELSLKEKRRRDALVLSAKAVIATEHGKRLLAWVINQTGVFAPCFTGNSTTFFLEGRRAVGLDLYKLLLTADPDAMHELVAFQREEQRHESS